jgi:hypothetical protein
MNQALLAVKARRWVDPQQELTSTLPREARVLINAGLIAVAPSRLLLAKSRTPRIADGSVRPRLGSANSSSGSCKHVSSHAGVDASI